MLLSKIAIRNYRLLVKSDLNIDSTITLIVGRNNTAKTSCMDLVGKVINNYPLTYNDYPLNRRKYACVLLGLLMRKKISFSQFCEKLPTTSIEFLIDYSMDDLDANLGALSPFIIDIDEQTTTAIVRVEYKLKTDENSLRAIFEPCFYAAGISELNIDELRDACIANFSDIFGLTIYAINPKNNADYQLKSLKELNELFQIYLIPAERALGEAGDQNSNSLGSLIAGFFSVDVNTLDPIIAIEVKELRVAVESANKSVQKQSNAILSSIVSKAVGFGYPNTEELQLGVNTRLKLDDQIKNQTELTYTSGSNGESLPSSHNGLGYKNLIKIEFLLAAFAEKIKQKSTSCIPLLFIEEPESHMHPQMQQTFASYLETFLKKISDVHIQTFITSHSAHIANTVDFSKIRYAQKTTKGVVYKDLNTFSKSNPSNMDFIRKYLTLTRCDLFFADKVIFVEGASERLLLPDMIRKCDENRLFDSIVYKLTAQYYALIEIGGAYAYKFIAFVNFLGIPCLILTDIDAMLDGRTKSVVSDGKITSNSTLKWWARTLKALPEEDTSKIGLEEIIALSADQKTIGKCHVEFQTKEYGLCGRSLEEAIKNVNRVHYNLSGSATEKDLEFTDKCKTDFALNLICQNPGYAIPKYITDGLLWLNNQKVLI